MVEKRFINLLKQLKKMNEEKLEWCEHHKKNMEQELSAIREKQFKIMMDDCKDFWEIWVEAGLEEPAIIDTGVSHFSANGMEEEFFLRLETRNNNLEEDLQVSIIKGDTVLHIYKYDDLPSELPFVFLDEWAEIAEHLEDELKRQILKIYDEKCKAAFPRHEELMATLDAAKAGLEKSLSRKKH